MKGLKKLGLCCCLGGLLSSSANGAGIDLLPIRADGDYAINGHEIILEGGGQKVILEIRVADWDPAELKAWQAVLESNGYSSGLRGTLTPYMPTCTTDADCEALLGPLGNGGARGGCGVPGVPPGFCAAGWIDNTNTNYVFAGEAELPAVDVSVLDYRYGSLLFAPPYVPDPGAPRYAGTLALDVPLDALGTFTVGLVTDGSSMQNEYGSFITPLTLTPALITVHCLTNSDCGDGNECTDDACEEDGWCSHENNYDAEVYCCDPADRTLEVIDDGNSCTADTCNPETGEVSHVPVDDGIPCDELFCQDDETCQSGICTGGTPHDCSHLDDQCNTGVCNEDADQCERDPAPHEDDPCDDGRFCRDNTTCQSGDCTGGIPHDCSYLDDQCNTGTCYESLDECRPNPGPHEDDPCDDELFCNDNETCQAGICTGGSPHDCSHLDDQCNTGVCNEDADECQRDPAPHEEDPCEDGMYCSVGETCTAGVCDGGWPRDCDDQIECTEPDWCDEDGDTCVNPPDDTYCPDDGLWCNGEEYCNPQVGCDRTDPPCNGPCDDDRDICLCDPPMALIPAARYLAMAARPEGSDIAQAIQITPDCPGGVSKYVGAPSPVTVDPVHGAGWNTAPLVEDPLEAVFLTPPEWGNLLVYDEDIVPLTTYVVKADCGTPGSPGLSGPTAITTQKSGDTVGRNLGGEWSPPDGTVNIVDALATLDKFKNLPGAPPIWWVDMIHYRGGTTTCAPDLRVDIVDVLVCIEGFKGFGFPETTGCAVPCP